jgi:UDP-N-acetylmuramoyl-tripeptide--D-alanyl-D-alanine ligase
LSFGVNYPIEKIISNRFIKSAKRKLTNNKNLIKIGITGSYGKTTVKEILYKILSMQYSTVATPKSYNTTMGVSKTINENLKPTTEVFVCEMGAKKSGEILELASLVSVDMGIVTSVGSQHIETFKSLDVVYNTKKELPDYLHNKLCVFNLMNSYTKKMYYEFVGKRIGVFVLYKKINNPKLIIKKSYNSFRIIHNNFYSKLYLYPLKNNYYAKVLNLTENGSEFVIYRNRERMGVINTNLLGVHNILNIVMATSIAMELSVSFSKIKSAIESISSISARLERYTTSKGAVVINNGYNSNIDSARSTLSVLNLFKDKTKVVITPGVIETGDDFTVNRKFGKIVGGVADEVIIVKDKNRDAILLGLNDCCFDMSKVYSVKSFNDVRGVIDIAGDNYVFMIENDLPDYYK